jgi:hypothetical protein
VSQNFKQERPRNRIESLANIQFEKNTRVVLMLQSLCCLLHKNEIMVNAMGLHKHTLTRETKVGNLVASLLAMALVIILAKL